MDLSENDVGAFRVAAGLMSICTDPSTGEPSFQSDQLEDFVDCVSLDLFTELSRANLEVNPVKEEEDEPVTLNGKKNNT